MEIKEGVLMCFGVWRQDAIGYWNIERFDCLSTGVSGGVFEGFVGVLFASWWVVPFFPSPRF